MNLLGIDPELEKVRKELENIMSPGCFALISYLSLLIVEFVEKA